MSGELSEIQKLYHKEEFSEAENKLNLFLEKYPEHTEGTVLLARIKFFTHNIADAENILNDFLKDHRQNTHALLWLGRILSVQEEKTDQAVNIFQSLLDLDPENHSARYYMARLHERKGNYRAALREYQNSLALEYELSRIHLQLGLLLKQLQMKERAEYHFGRVKLLNVNPNDVNEADNITE